MGEVNEENPELSTPQETVEVFLESDALILQETLSLLNTWDVPEVFVDEIIRLRLTPNHLRHLTESELGEIFRSDLRAKIDFRIQLNEWRSQPVEPSNPRDNCQLHTTKSAIGQEIYFIPRPSREGNPSGLLYDKFKNLRRSYINKGYIKKRARVPHNPDDAEQHPLVSEEQVESAIDSGGSRHEAMVSSQMWLKTNFEPLDVVKQEWLSTFELRCPGGKYYYASISGTPKL